VTTQPNGQGHMFPLDTVPEAIAPGTRVVPGYRKPVALKLVTMPWESARWLLDESRARRITVSSFLAIIVAEAMENRLWASNPHKGKGR